MSWVEEFLHWMRGKCQLLRGKYYPLRQNYHWSRQKCHWLRQKYHWVEAKTTGLRQKFPLVGPISKTDLTHLLVTFDKNEHHH